MRIINRIRRTAESPPDNDGGLQSAPSRSIVRIQAAHQSHAEKKDETGMEARQRHVFDSDKQATEAREEGVALSFRLSLSKNAENTDGGQIGVARLTRSRTPWHPLTSVCRLPVTLFAPMGFSIGSGMRSMSPLFSTRVRECLSGPIFCAQLGRCAPPCGALRCPCLAMPNFASTQRQPGRCCVCSLVPMLHPQLHSPSLQAGWVISPAKDGLLPCSLTRRLAHTATTTTAETYSARRK